MHIAKSQALALVIGFAAAGAAFAATEIDTDGDGQYSMEEMKAAYPELTEAVFTAVDRDADGMVSAEELAEATELGLLPNLSDG